MRVLAQQVHLVRSLRHAPIEFRFYVKTVDGQIGICRSLLLKKFIRCVVWYVLAITSVSGNSR